jgi:hypothetical protein
LRSLGLARFDRRESSESSGASAKRVAETLADIATGRGPAAARGANGTPILEIAGPREENLVEAARLLAAHRGEQLRIEGVSNPDDPDGALYESGASLPGPDAILAGPNVRAMAERSGRWEFV